MNNKQHIEELNRMYDEYNKLNLLHKMSTNYQERKEIRKKARKLNNQITDYSIKHIVSGGEA